MKPSSVNQNVSVILAHRTSEKHLVDVFIELKLWFDNITIVGPDCSKTSEQIKSLNGKWIDTESCSIQDLWEKGMQSTNSSWYLLLESSEYISAVLKESIAETININPSRPTWFPIKREIFFLKQRLKYPLEWTHDPKPGLLFKGPKNFKKIDFQRIEKKVLKGKSIYFSETTLAEIITNSIHRANEAAVKLHQIKPEMGIFILILRALTDASLNFLKKWVLLKGMREGFEGLVFSLMDTVTVIMGYVRYHEKYIRSGRQIEDNLGSVKKILVLKLRGLGDAVLGTPVLKNIKALMPNVTISLVTFNFSKPIFENNPHIDELYGISGNPEPKEINELLKKLNAQNYDLVINLHARNFSSKLVKKIRARWKINRSYFIREKYSDVLISSDHKLDRPSIERDLDCLRAIGFKPLDKNPELFITKKETEWADEFLLQKGVDPLKKLVIIHVSTSKSYTDWGLDNFIKLAGKLINDYGHQVLACFPEKEESISNLVSDQVEEILIHVGSLRQSIALIARADLMIDNCSGPSHIASALNIKTLVLMGADYKNIYRDSEIYQENSFLFYKNVSCRDMFLSQCLPPDPCQNKICLDHPVEEVLRKSLELLNK